MEKQTILIGLGGTGKRVVSPVFEASIKDKSKRFSIFDIDSKDSDNKNPSKDNEDS